MALFIKQVNFEKGFDFNKNGWPQIFDQIALDGTVNGLALIALNVVWIFFTAQTKFRKSPTV